MTKWKRTLVSHKDAFKLFVLPVQSLKAANLHFVIIKIVADLISFELLISEFTKSLMSFLITFTHTEVLLGTDKEQQNTRWVIFLHSVLEPLPTHIHTGLQNV